MKKKLVFVLLLALIVSYSAFAAGSSETAGNEIVVGSIQDITGPTSSLGKMVDSGAKLAIDEINAQGGVDGKKIRASGTGSDLMSSDLVKKAYLGQ